MMIDAWLDTHQGIFWATVVGFVALAAIPGSVLTWGLIVLVRDAREYRRVARREQVARELRSRDTLVNIQPK